MKEPPKPTPAKAVNDHVKNEGMRILKSLNIEDSPEIMETVLVKLEDMLRTFNYRDVRLSDEIAASYVSISSSG